MYRQTKIYLSDAPEVRGVEGWIFVNQLGRPDERSIAEPLTFRDLTKDDEAMRLDPTFYIQHEDAQHLMNELWKIGIRPSDIGTAGHLESVKYHLEDMRKLVFDT